MLSLFGRLELTATATTQVAQDDTNIICLDFVALRVHMYKLMTMSDDGDDEDGDDDGSGGDYANHVKFELGITKSFSVKNAI